MLPVPIADGVLNDTLPEHTIQTARELKFFLAENAKSARAFLKFCGHPSPIASLSIEERASSGFCKGTRLAQACIGRKRLRHCELKPDVRASRIQAHKSLRKLISLVSASYRSSDRLLFF